MSFADVNTFFSDKFLIIYFFNSEQFGTIWDNIKLKIKIIPNYPKLFRI